MVLNLLLALTFLSVPTFAAGPIIAKAGKKQITLKEFKNKYFEVRDQTINPPTPSEFLEDLIRYEIGIQEAQKNKIEKNPDVKEHIRQVLYKSQVEKAIGKEVSKIKVSDNEMKQYYKTNPEIRTSHILVSFKVGASTKEKNEAFKRAKEIYNDVKSSKRPFEQLAKLYSDDNLTKDVGGDIGYQTKVTLVPNYYDAALKLQVGQISQLVESRFGYHIIKLTGKRSYQQADKRQIRAAVFDKKRKFIFDNYFAKLKKSYPINKNVKLLEQIK
jgi:peptidyl-prolyl cis-trans isomerase C/peptidyl-prolyl cis-trans isomerase D